VDDLKASHVMKWAIDDLVEWLKFMYEDHTPLKPSRGKRHDYIGMILDYAEKGKLKIIMTDYVQKMLKDFPFQQMLNKKANTPAAEHLYQVNPKGTKLGEERKEIFHTTVAKRLFVAKRARGDILPTIAFLCTRVQAPDEDDWKKLLRLLNYLNGTKSLFTTLEADKGARVNTKWHADSAFAVHDDMRSQTGGVLTLGKGAAQSLSSKQKINARSSTEAKLVAADDIMGPMPWTKHFPEAQGCNTDNTLHQDKQSAIKLEMNGKESSGKRTRHINIKYFFIKDVLDRGLAKLEFCPTDDMLADFNTKPLQGTKFKLFRKKIMNLQQQ